VRGTPDVAEQLDVRGCVCEAQSFMGEVPESWKRVNCVAYCKSVEEAESLPDWVAGALLGPIMQPQSALEIVETLGTSLCINAKASVILWGGVDTDTIEDFKKMSPAGVATLGGVWNYADPVNAFIKLNRAVSGI
jgi:thiamine monophosphate synthase